MSELVSVFPGTIANSYVNLCSARELHRFMQIGRRFTTWVRERIQRYQFEEGVDFQKVSISPESGRNPRGRHGVDYHLTLDMAKELAMVENNPRGRQARRYFIECERRLLARFQMSGNTISAKQQRAIQEAVAERVQKLPANRQRSAYPRVWGSIKSHFQVGTYKDLPSDRFDEAIAFVRSIKLDAPSLGDPSDPVVCSSEYRKHARDMALGYYDQLRELIPEGVAVPSWDDEAERKVADGVCAMALMSNRWVMSFDHEGRVQLAPVPKDASIVNARDTQNIETLVRERVPIDMLPNVTDICMRRLAHAARRNQ